MQGITVLERFYNEYYPFLYFGFVSSFSYQQLTDFLESTISVPSLLKKYASFYYGKYFYAINANDNTIVLNRYIKKIPRVYTSECVWGIIDGFSEHAYRNLDMIENFEPVQVIETIKKHIFKDSTIADSIYPSIYQGLGLSLSLKTMGQLTFDDNDNLGIIIPSEYLQYVYEGFGVGLAMRYGQDADRKIQMIESSVPFQYQAVVKKGAMSGFED